MIERLASDPDGLALLLIVAVIGLALLLGAMFVERLVLPRHERTDAGRAERARVSQRRNQRPVPHPEWTPPSGWIGERYDTREDLQ